MILLLQRMNFWNIWSFQRIEEIYKLGFSAEMKKSGKTNRFEPTDMSWANDFPKCVALFKSPGCFSLFEKITGFNLEEASSKRSPKNKKRCIVMLYFSCFGHCNWALIMSWWRWILENKKRFLFTTDPFTKTSLNFATTVKVWKIRFNLYNLFFSVLKYLIFSCFSLHLAGHILIDWRWIFKNQERFLLITNPFTKKSLSFDKDVMYGEI